MKHTTIETALVAAILLSTPMTASADQVDDVLGICDTSNPMLAGISSGGYDATGTGFHQLTVPGAAKCNDGTDPIMFIQPAETDSNDWLIYVVGGNVCKSYDDCRERWLGTQGGGTFTCSKMSSARYSAAIGSDDDDEVGIGGILAGTDLAMNATLFANYNRVAFHYCSSDQWTGDADGPTQLKDDDHQILQVRRIAGVARVCVNAAHGYVVGDDVTVACGSHPGFSGTHEVVAVTPNCFDYGLAGGSFGFQAATGTTHRSFELWFQGHRVLQALFSRLMGPDPLISDDEAVELPLLSEIDPDSMVVVAGDSTGSGGARLNAEWMWSQLSGVLPMENFRFVLDASNSPSREREDVNPAVDSCDLYTHTAGVPDPAEPNPYVSPDDTWNFQVEADYMVPLMHGLWSAFGGPAGCVANHLAQPPGALPVDACLDNGHVGAVHFPWPMFQRQAQRDAVARPDQPPTDCTSLPPLRAEWAQHVATQFDLFHEYAGGDRATHAITSVQQQPLLNRVCVGPHDLVVGDYVRVRSPSHPSFNRPAVEVVGVGPTCFSYAGPPGPGGPQQAATGTVNRMLYSPAEDARYFLGAHDGVGFTGAPCEAFPMDYASFSASCSHHDIIITNEYFGESIDDGTGTLVTMREAVESFVTGGAVPAQLQDIYPAVSGFCPP